MEAPEPQGKTITIRIARGKEDVYPEFKRIVTEKLGSSTCYTLTSLMEAFNSAIKNLPNPSDPLTVKFLRQNVQINIGCAFHYDVKRARRKPEPPIIELDKNRFFPLLLEEWKTMKPEARRFWIKRLEENGIFTHSSISTRNHTPRPRKSLKSKLRKFMKQCKTNVLRGGFGCR